MANTALDFSTNVGGIAGTGFTHVLASAARSTPITERLARAGGKLTVTSTSGDMASSANNQANALFVAINTSADFTIQTRITSPLAFSRNRQNGGIWVGRGQDDYVKLAVGFQDGTGIRLTSERVGAFSTAAAANLSLSGVTTLDLRLTGTKGNSTLTAQYRTNSSSESAWKTVGTVTNARVFTTGGRAGIVTTNFGSTQTVRVPFDSFSAKSGAAAPTPAGGPVNASDGIAGSELDQKIAIDPTNINNIVAVATDESTNGTAIFVTRSTDGGKTWNAAHIGSAADGLPAGRSRIDPRLTFDRFGNLYVCYLVGFAQGDVRVMVARSSDGGATFTSAATAASGTETDYPVIAAGPDASNAAREAIYVTYQDITAGRVRVAVATSSGKGQFSNFQAPVTVSDARGANYAVPAVGPDGELAIVWQNPEDGQGPASVRFDRDTNGLSGGLTFGPDRTITSTNVGGFDYIPAQPDRSVDAQPQVVFDRSTGSRSGRLYFAYLDEAGNESNDTDVYLRYSDDLGSTWSSRVRVNDDSSGKSQFLPALAVDNTTGRVGIAWRDARGSRGNITVQTYAAISTDGGRTFGRNRILSTATSRQNNANGNTSGVGDLDFGDYAGAAFHGGRFIASWTDNSNSTGDNANGTNSRFDLYTAVFNG